jgi:hypothetical protein
VNAATPLVATFSVTGRDLADALRSNDAHHLARRREVPEQALIWEPSSNVAPESPGRSARLGDRKQRSRTGIQYYHPSSLSRPLPSLLRSFAASFAAVSGESGRNCSSRDSIDLARTRTNASFVSTTPRRRDAATMTPILKHTR